MSRNLRLYLEDITESCDKILSYTVEMSFEAFIADDRTYGDDDIGLFSKAVGEEAGIVEEVGDRHG